jgi:hypothetical protein
MKYCDTFKLEFLLAAETLSIFLSLQGYHYVKLMSKKTSLLSPADSPFFWTDSNYHQHGLRC